MEDRRKHIDDLFRDGLGDYRETPGSQVWASLEQRLPAPAAAAEQPSRRWLWYLLLLLLLAAVGYIVFRKSVQSGTSTRIQNDTARSTALTATPGEDEIPPAGALAAGQGQREGATDPESQVGTGINRSSGKDETERTEKANTPHTSQYGDRTINRKITASPEAADQVHQRKGRTEKQVQADPEDSHASEIQTAPQDERGKSNTSGGIAVTEKTSARTNGADRAVGRRGNISGKDLAGSGQQKNLGTGDRPRGSKPQDQPPGARAVRTTQSDPNRENRSARVASNARKTATTGPGETQRTNLELGSKPDRTPAKTGGSRQALTDNSYLRQPVPEDDETGNEAGYPQQSGIARTAEKEDEGKRALLYIPPEDAGAEHTRAANAGSSGKQREAGVTDQQANSEENPATATRSYKAAGEQSAGKGIIVSPEASDNTALQVKPASFGPQASAPVRPAEFTSKSGMQVRTEGTSARQEKTTTTVSDPSGGTFGSSPQNRAVKKKGSSSAADLNSLGLAADGSGVRSNMVASSSVNPATGEQATTQPSESGGSGGGGGGGGVSPTKNGSRFRFDLGIKAGYERGFASFTTNTFIFSPYLQWNVTPWFSFVLQPGFRYNQLNRTDVFDLTKSYHRVTSSTIDSNHVVTTDTFGAQVIQRNYIYKNSYDSIVIGGALLKKNFWEIEIPLMLRYKIASNFAVFGGLSLLFGNLIQTGEQRDVYANLQRSGTLSIAPDSSMSTPPPIPSAESYFSYHTPNISTAGPASFTPATNPARLGLMFGFSYELQNRIMIDVLYKQTVSDMRFVPNEQLRKIYTQPYLRIMLGVKLFGSGETEQVKNPAGL